LKALILPRRDRFLNLGRTGNTIAGRRHSFSYEEAKAIAQRIGYPVLVRPSYVLGGRAMEVVYNDETLKEYMQLAVGLATNHPF